MAYVLTTASSIDCGHTGSGVTPGTVVLGLGTTKLTVNHKPALLSVDVAPQTVSGCTFTPKQCVATTAVNPTSMATKLTVGGQGVVLATLSGTTQAAPPPATPPTYPLLRATSANQTKLTAV